MIKFRIKQVDDTFTPQVWRIWWPFWMSIYGTKTGHDWSECRASTLEDATTIIKVYYYRQYPRPKTQIIYHYPDVGYEK